MLMSIRQLVKCCWTDPGILPNPIKYSKHLREGERLKANKDESYYVTYMSRDELDHQLRNLDYSERFYNLRKFKYNPWTHASSDDGTEIIQPPTQDKHNRLSYCYTC